MRSAAAPSSVLAGAQGQHGNVLVQVRRQADVHSLHGGVARGVFGARVLGDGGEIQHRPRAAEVALRAGEIAGEAALIVACDSRHFRAGYLPPGLDVGAAHEAQAEDRDSHAK